jgi:hypothetical protein
MSNWAGKFKYIVILTLIGTISKNTLAAESEFKFDKSSWAEFSHEVELQKERDRRNGYSYVISGSLALIGGIWGNSISEDTAEKGIYTIFQTIGVASVGYGAYVWQIGGEERSIYQTLQYSKLSSEQKSQFLQAYNFQRKEREHRDRIIRAVTHGLIAGLNFYNATQQSQAGLKNTLFFVGGVNLLAAISFSYDF